MRVKIAAVLLVTFAGSFLLAAGQPGAALSYARDVEPIFLAECGDCHGAEKPKKGLDLSQGKGHAALVGRPSQEAADTLLVKAGDPAASYLWAKLQHTTSEGKGMPRTMFGAKKLAPEQLDLVERWIRDGAQP
jgi:mono/diheme cytochrome c family protein